MQIESQVVKLPKSLVAQLKARKHPGQTLAGVIEEMILQLQHKELPNETNRTN